MVLREAPSVLGPRDGCRRDPLFQRALGLGSSGQLPVTAKGLCVGVVGKSQHACVRCHSPLIRDMLGQGALMLLLM